MTDVVEPVVPEPAAEAPPAASAESAAAARAAGAHLAAVAADAGLRRIHILAWRDLDDPEAGGSELHAATIAARWAAAGIDVTMRSSKADGHPTFADRDGYRVVRKAGRYVVFPRSAVSGALGRDGRPDGLVEIWNGMPFFSPVWARCPRIVFLHHVHAEMWRMVLKPALLGWLGERFEFAVAPRFYEGARIVTLSESSKAEIVELLRLPEVNISVVPPGVDPRFTPGGIRSPHPLVVAVGRLVPVKRFDRLIEALVAVRRQHPDLEAVIAGEGYDRPLLEQQRRDAGAESWIRLPGRISDDELVDLYRRAWVLASTSAREGWGMTVTEAAACATPAVVSDIAGHRDAVAPGLSGFLTGNAAETAARLDQVLSDTNLRTKLAAGALDHAARFTWDGTARAALELLADEAARRRARHRR
jgi:glycosyltransferase involved in cell wall biosynthesis